VGFDIRTFLPVEGSQWFVELKGGPRDKTGLHFDNPPQLLILDGHQYQQVYTFIEGGEDAFDFDELHYQYIGLTEALRTRKERTGPVRLTDNLIWINEVWPRFVANGRESGYPDCCIQYFLVRCIEMFLGGFTARSNRLSKDDGRVMCDECYENERQHDS